MTEQAEVVQPLQAGAQDARQAAVMSSREESMVRAFVEIADGLLGDFDVQDLLHRLAEHCVDLVHDAAACGVMLNERPGLAVVAAFPHIARTLDVHQLELGEGLCLDCAHTGHPVSSEDLADETDRWPSWRALALESGFRTVYATPMRWGEQVVGTLNLFGRTPMQRSERDMLVVRGLADAATITILQQRSSLRAAVVNTQLQTALASRVAVEQAKGVLAQSLGVDMDEAFAILRHNSRSTNTKLTVLADYLVTGRIRAHELHRPGTHANARPGVRSTPARRPLDS